MCLTYPAHLRDASLKLSDAPLKTWQHTNESLLLGHGKATFEAAADNLFSFRAHARAGVEVSPHPQREDAVMLRFGPTLSPCLILQRERTNNRAVLVYGTLPGHVECGEEAFIVELHDDGRVMGKCCAFSRHAWWPAKLAPWAARRVQLHITRKYLEGMRP